MTLIFRRFLSVANSVKLPRMSSTTSGRNMLSTASRNSLNPPCSPWSESRQGAHRSSGIRIEPNR